MAHVKCTVYLDAMDRREEAVKARHALSPDPPSFLKNRRTGSTLASVLVDHVQQLVIHGFFNFFRPGSDGVTGAMCKVIAHQ